MPITLLASTLHKAKSSLQCPQLASTSPIHVGGLTLNPLNLMYFTFKFEVLEIEQKPCLFIGAVLVALYLLCHLGQFIRLIIHQLGYIHRPVASALEFLPADF
jgi:hypothetical protein